MSKQNKQSTPQQHSRPPAKDRQGGAPVQRAVTKPTAAPSPKPPATAPTRRDERPRQPPTQADVSRMMSAVAKRHEGAVPKQSYVADMQSRLAKSTDQGGQSGPPQAAGRPGAPRTAREAGAGGAQKRQS